MPDFVDQDVSPYDHVAFMENFCGLEDLARDSVRVFNSMAPRMLAEIEVALAARDARQLEVTSHTFKGAVSNFYAARARELANRLEKIGKSGDLQDAEELLDVLKLEVSVLMAALLTAFPSVRVA